MLSYAVASGVADGWLPRRYERVGWSLLTTARAQVDRHGFVRGACGAPRFDRPGTSAEAQAFFLLAAAAGHRLDPSGQDLAAEVEG